MAWRIGTGWRSRPPEQNRSDFHNVVNQGPAPGLLAFRDDLAVGWCQLTPRHDVPALDRNWRIKRIDDLPVWSLSCFYVRKAYRRQGIMSELISRSLKAARRAQAPCLEAYPLDRDETPSATSTGVTTTYERLGFREVARRTPPRPIYEARAGQTLTVTHTIYDYPPYYDVLFSWNRGIEAATYDRVFERAGVPRDEPILEAACGTGLVTRQPAHLNRSTTTFADDVTYAGAFNPLISFFRATDELIYVNDHGRRVELMSAEGHRRNHTCESFAELVARSGAFGIESWHPETRRPDQGPSLFDAEHPAPACSPGRLMAVLRRL